MRRSWSAGLLLLAGCLPTLPDEPATRQVSASPFDDSRHVLPAKANYPPATSDASFRVLLVKDKLLNDNPQLGIKPYVIAVGSANAEIFHAVRQLISTSRKAWSA